MYVLSTDSGVFKKALENEPDVKLFLTYVFNNPEKYTITAFTRGAISYKLEKTELLTHNYYVLHETETQFHTLSFSGTAKAYHSKGAWTLDSDTDLESYVWFLEGENKWKVVEIKTANGIDTKATVFNILEKINSTITYYYKDHLKDKPDMHNCITALEETIVERQ
ncbi:hypothetical protein FACS1894142_3680 [Spirochaetia bacterium]|nr:hypothetical protein FACS1894142_3680 [Spirochaetia bacterium]